MDPHALLVDSSVFFFSSLYKWWIRHVSLLAKYLMVRFLSPTCQNRVKFCHSEKLESLAKAGKHQWKENKFC